MSQNQQTRRSESPDFYHHLQLLTYTAYKDIQLIHSAGLKVASSSVAPSFHTESWSLCAALTCYTDLLVCLRDLPAWTVKFV